VQGNVITKKPSGEGEQERKEVIKWLRDYRSINVRFAEIL